LENALTGAGARRPGDNQTRRGARPRAERGRKEMSNEDLEELAREYRVLKAEEKAKKGNAEIVASKIKEELEERGKDEETVGIFIIRNKTIKSMRFAISRFKAAMSEYYNQFLEEVETTRFTVD
jgi:hypothetical protein